MSPLIATIRRPDGSEYKLSIRELTALKLLLETEEAKKLRDGLFKAYMETANCTEEEAKATVGPMLLEGFIDRAREMAKQ